MVANTHTALSPFLPCELQTHKWTGWEEQTSDISVIFSWSCVRSADGYASPFRRGTGCCDAAQPGPDEHGGWAIPGIPEAPVPVAAEPLPPRDLWQLAGALRQVWGVEGGGVLLFFWGGEGMWWAGCDGGGGDGGDSTASFSSLLIDRMSVIFLGCLCGSPENDAINSFN